MGKTRITRTRNNALAQLVATFCALFLVNLAVLTSWNVAANSRGGDGNIIHSTHQEGFAGSPAHTQKDTGARRLQISGIDEYASHLLKYDFYGTRQSEPSQEEYQDLLCQTRSYYNWMLKMKLGVPVFTHLHPEEWVYKESANMPVHMNVTVEAKYADETLISPEVVNRCIIEADMSDYIEGFVWRTQPERESVFFNVGNVQAETSVHVGRLSGEPTQQDNVVLSNTMLCDATGTYVAKFEFGFFPGRAKEPLQSEIAALVPLTENFLTSTLQEQFPRRRIQLFLDCAGYSYNATLDMPLLIKCKLSGIFVLGEDIIPPEYIQEKLTLNEDNKATMMQKYITEAVWKTPPQGQSAFFEVNRAKMKSKIERQKYAVSETLLPQPSGETPGNAGTEAPDRGVSGFFAGIPVAETDPPETDPSMTVIRPMYNLEPIMTTVDECQEHVDEANADSDEYLAKTEYVDLVNSMVEGAYSGYPYEALPLSLMNVYESMSSKRPEGEVIDLVESFIPNPSEEEIKHMKQDRAAKLCRSFLTIANEAITQGLLRAAMVGSTVGIYLQRETPAETPNAGGANRDVNDVPESVVSIAFEYMVENEVMPMMANAMNDGLRRVLNEGAVSEIKGSVYIPEGASSIENMAEVACRGEAADDPRKQCFSAEAKVLSFVKGEDSPFLAPKVATKVQEVVTKAVADGDFTKELARLDESSSWTAKSIYTLAPTSAPSLSPTSMPVENLIGTNSPTPAQASEEEKSFTDSIGGKKVAGAATLSIVIMVALQCGREFLVDLAIRCCKACCRRYRRTINDESEFGDFSGKHEGSEGEEDQQRSGRTDFMTEESGSGRVYESDDEEDEEEEGEDEGEDVEGEKEEDDYDEEEGKEEEDEEDESKAPTNEKADEEAGENRLEENDALDYSLVVDDVDDQDSVELERDQMESGMLFSQPTLSEDSDSVSDELAKLDELEQGFSEDIDTAMSDIEVQFSSSRQLS